MMGGVGVWLWEGERRRTRRRRGRGRRDICGVAREGKEGFLFFFFFSFLFFFVLSCFLLTFGCDFEEYEKEI